MNRWARGTIWGGGGVAFAAAFALFNVIVLSDPTAQDKVLCKNMFCV